METTGGDEFYRYYIYILDTTDTKLHTPPPSPPPPKKKSKIVRSSEPKTTMRDIYMNFESNLTRNMSIKEQNTRS